MKQVYPLIIIGAGPAGLSASIYASRYALPHLVIGAAPGGLMFEAHRICNFPTEKDISGREITQKITDHAKSLGATIVNDEVVRITPEKNSFLLATSQEKEYRAQTLILAIGTQHRQLNLPDEKKFLGKGLSYCVTCDGQFYKGQTVAVIGSGDSATTASLYLAKIAKKVYQICRGPKLHGERVWIQQVQQSPQVEIIYQREVAGLKGKDALEKLILNQAYQGKKELPVQGLFVEIGTVPQSLLINQLHLKTDERGYIKVHPDQSTSLPRVWAAGDITNGSNNLRQIITACGEGAIAAASVFEFLQKEA